LRTAELVRYKMHIHSRAKVESDLRATPMLTQSASPGNGLSLDWFAGSKAHA